MKVIEKDSTTAGLFIPLRYPEGSSVDLIYTQAMATIEDLAQQQLDIGLRRLFDATPALAGFVLRLHAADGKFDLLTESVELAADAPDDTRLADVRSAISAFIEGTVPVLLYGNLDGRRLSREDIAKAEGAVPLRPIAPSGRAQGVGVDEEGITVAGITLAFPKTDAQPGYIRMLDAAGEESLFLDTAIAHAEPAYVIRIFVDLFRSFASAGYAQPVTQGTSETRELSEVA